MKIVPDFIQKLFVPEHKENVEQSEKIPAKKLVEETEAMFRREIQDFHVVKAEATEAQPAEQKISTKQRDQLINQKADQHISTILNLDGKLHYPKERIIFKDHKAFLDYIHYESKRLESKLAQTKEQVKVLAGQSRENPDLQRIYDYTLLVLDRFKTWHTDKNIDALLNATIDVDFLAALEQIHTDFVNSLEQRQNDDATEVKIIAMLRLIERKDYSLIDIQSLKAFDRDVLGKK